MRHLVLFDIDGTLLRCGSQVRPLFLGALLEIYGTHGDLEGYDFSGRTDPQIVLDLLAGAGIEAAEVLPRLDDMRTLYHRRLERGLERAKMQLLPGVRSLLEHLMARRDVVLGLLTGNWQVCAQVKLRHFDLERFFEFGAFGDDGVARRELVPVALERAAAASGKRFEPRDVLIVGDSIRDVDCAKAAGARSLAVTTGFTSTERLRAAGADWIFSDLSRAAREYALFRPRNSA